METMKTRHWRPSNSSRMERLLAITRPKGFISFPICSRGGVETITKSFCWWLCCRSCNPFWIHGRHYDAWTWRWLFCQIYRAYRSMSRGNWSRFWNRRYLFWTAWSALPYVISLWVVLGARSIALYFPTGWWGNSPWTAQRLGPHPNVENTFFGPCFPVQGEFTQALK